MSDKTKCYKISNPEITKNFNNTLLENPNYLRSVGFKVLEEPKKPKIDPKNEVIDIKDIPVEPKATEDSKQPVAEGLEESAEMTLEQAKEAYLKKFNKKAHPKAKLETILKKLV